MIKERFRLFSTLITAIPKNVQKLKNRYAKELNLKPVHILWIYILNKYSEGLSCSELAQKSSVNRSLVSREINALFDKKLLYTNDEKKYREKLLLTEAGKQKAELIENVVNEIQVKVGQNISNDDLKIFYKVLTQLNEDFERLIESDEIEQMILYYQNNEDSKDFIKNI